MPGCDYSPAVQHWARMYAQAPNDFSSSLSEAMPYLLLVLEQIEKHRLPGEFASCLMSKATTPPIASSGDRAAGIWQLMPDTAREAGLRITDDYDGRLDVYASTVTAIGLLQQYNDEFGDWRLADMAFNAGMYKVRQLLAIDKKNEWTAHEMGHLHVNPGTHDHLAKLLALACIVSDPWRYRIRLPEPTLRRHPRRARPARAAGPAHGRAARRHRRRATAASQSRLRTRAHARPTARFICVIPANSRLAVEQTLGKLPQYVWRDWHEAVLKQAETISIFAMLDDLDPSALAAINGVAPDAALLPARACCCRGRPGTRISPLRCRLRRSPTRQRSNCRARSSSMPATRSGTSRIATACTSTICCAGTA